MSVALPKTLDAREFTGRGRRIRGMMQGRALARLAAAVDGFDGAVRVDLALRRDEQARMRVTGEVHGAVMMTCQRCLEALRVRLDCRVALGVVSDEREADCLPDDVEPLLLENGQASLDVIVEDELLLALPAVALHDDCEAPRQQGQDDGQSDGQGEGPAAARQAGRETPRKPNPFAALREMQR